MRGDGKVTVRKRIRKVFTKQEQMSEALFLNLILAFSGGFQDAYTYMVRDNVFANAQTGNVVLMSTYLMQGLWQRGLMYLFPLFSFMAGIFISDNVGFYYRNAKKIHWRQGIVAVEALIMLVAAFLPQNLNMLCNCLISFSCALQVQSFKKVHGNVYASTMCIGNIRSGVVSFSKYIKTRDVRDIRKAGDYFAVIVTFAIGAGFGGNLSKIYLEKTILVSCVLLVICSLLMDLDKD